jgi:uncharacterized membrane protein
MNSRIFGILHALLVLLAVGVAVYAYPLLPEVVASNWDAAGNVNGHMPKFINIVIVPILMLGIWLFWLAIPRLDPLKANIESFRPWFDGMLFFLQLFILYIFVLTILYNVGFPLNIGQFLIPALALLFGYIGILLPRTKRNWFVGIRTPWTLSSDDIWDKTHALGGKLFQLAGVVILFGIFVPLHALWLALVPIVIAALVPVGYSYWLFKKNSENTSS